MDLNPVDARIETTFKEWVKRIDRVPWDHRHSGEDLGVNQDKHLVLTIDEIRSKGWLDLNIALFGGHVEGMRHFFVNGRRF